MKKITVLDEIQFKSELRDLYYLEGRQALVKTIYELVVAAKLGLEVLQEEIKANHG